MDRSAEQATHCSIARTLEILGEKWTLLILRESFYGATRFQQFHRVLECPRNLLSERLHKLVGQGILETSEYKEPGSRARNEYHLTGKGLELMYVLQALMDWGDRHEAGPEGPPMITQHTECGGHIHVSFTCENGHVVDDPGEIEQVPGPGFPLPVPA